MPEIGERVMRDGYAISEKGIFIYQCNRAAGIEDVDLASLRITLLEFPVAARGL